MRGLSLGVVGVAAAVLLSAGSTYGQPGGQGGGPGGGERVRAMGGPGGMMGFMGGGRDPYEPPVNSADLDRYSGILGLTPDQKEAAKALLDASMAEFQPAAKAAREKVEQIRSEFRETQDPSVWQGMGDVMRDYRKARNTVEQTFMSDLRGLLTDDQAARWPTVERTHRRERTIGRGLMSGERVDLIQLVDRMNLSDAEKASIRPVLDQYETDLDRELVKRNEVYDQGEAQGAAAFQQGNMDRVQEMFEKGREASKRVRDVNNRYARQIEALLPDGQRAAFTEQVKRESFPMIYRETYAQRVLAAAEKFTDLDDTQRASLTALRESFTRDLAAVNSKMEAATLERENSADMQQMFFQRGGGPMQDLRQSRRDLEQTAVQRVRDLLTEDQRSRLPDRNAEGEAEGRRFRATDEGDRGRNGGDGERPRRRRERQDRDPAPTPPPPANPR